MLLRTDVVDGDSIKSNDFSSATVGSSAVAVRESSDGEENAKDDDSAVTVLLLRGARFFLFTFVTMLGDGFSSDFTATFAGPVFATSLFAGLGLSIVDVVMEFWSALRLSNVIFSVLISSNSFGSNCTI